MRLTLSRPQKLYHATYHDGHKEHLSPKEFATLERIQVPNPETQPPDPGP